MAQTVKRLQRIVYVSQIVRKPLSRFINSGSDLTARRWEAIPGNVRWSANSWMRSGISFLLHRVALSLQFELKLESDTVLLAVQLWIRLHDWRPRVACLFKTYRVLWEYFIAVVSFLSLQICRKWSIIFVNWILVSIFCIHNVVN